MKISDLKPGDAIALEAIGKRCVFVGLIEQHPLWPHLGMVIWREVNDAAKREDANESHRLGWVPGVWYHDALSPRMDIGVGARLLPATDAEREENLRCVLIGAPE